MPSCKTSLSDRMLSMNILQDWLYPSSLEKAKEAQYLMAQKVCLEDAFQSIDSIGGMDVSNNLFDPEELIYASVVRLNFQSLQVIETNGVIEKQEFPYISGFLGFREAPSLINAVKKLKMKPDILMVDGHGISHPRGLGIASHLGVLLDVPTIGVAKSILVGTPESPLGNTPGSYVPLIWKNKIIGMLLRSKKNCNPLVISVGHKVCLDTALDIVKKCLKGYRLPEPTRQAHLAANESRKSHL